MELGPYLDLCQRLNVTRVYERSFSITRGVTLRCHDGLHIVISTQLNRNRFQRYYTLAHELAEIEVDKSGFQFDTPAQRERYCQVRAGDILVPSLLLEEALALLQHPRDIQQQVFPHASIQVIGRRIADVRSKIVYFHWRPENRRWLYDPQFKRLRPCRKEPFTRHGWRRFDLSPNYFMALEE